MELMIVIFFASLLIVALGAVVKPLRSMFLTEPLIAMATGILLGPELLNLIASGSEDILKLACQFTIAMALMATALRIPGNIFRKNKATLSVLVIFGMILMWMSASLIIYVVFDKFSFGECLLLGAIISPTDPVVASTMITGEKARKYLPSSIRDSLSFEAGVNDGLAFPIVMLAILLLEPGDLDLSKWVTKTVLYENVLPVILAYGIGHFAGLLMHKAHKAEIMDSKSLLAFSLGLAFLLLSAFEIMNMNGIIAVFVGGLGFTKHLEKNEELQEERIQEAMERLFTVPVFFLFGLFIPWDHWSSLGWTAVWICLLVLMFRRLPILLALMPIMPKFKGRFYDILLMGWFGPIGVAAIFYALHAKEKTGWEDAWVITSLIVFASTIVHGFTSRPVEKQYFKRLKD